MDHIQDVDFQDITEDKKIRGTALYYNTSQVSQILNIPDSTVRYYSKQFEGLLDIEIVNKQRKYKQADIDKLKFIVELKEEGMSIKQIQEYCSEVSFEEGKGIQVKETNPLSIKALSKALMEEQQKQIAEMEERICLRIAQALDMQNKSFEEMKDKIKEEVSVTVDEVMNEVVTEVLNDKVTEIKEDFKETNQEVVEMRKQLYELKMAFVKPEEIKPIKKGLFGWFTR